MEYLADFLEDWRLQMLDMLTSAEYRIDNNEPLDSVSYKYWNVKRKELFPAPRKVYEPEGFAIPSNQLDAYSWLKSKILAGENVNPHQSKRLSNTSFEDPLFNDWGIHHFHLTTRYEEDGSGWVERDGPLLFAFVRGDAFYSLKIGDHGDWCDKDLLRIIHENWPDLIAPYRLNIAGVEREHEPDLKLMRRKGITVFHEVAPGAYYCAIGGGYSCTGISGEALRMSDMFIGNISALEQEFRRNIDYFIAEFKAKSLDVNKRLEFKFTVNEFGFHVWERSLNVKILLAYADFTKSVSSPALSISYFSPPAN